MQTRYYFIAVLFSMISLLNHAQVLSLNELTSAPKKDSEQIDELLRAKGWEKYNYEVHSDSGFVKHIWVIKNNYNDLKSYFTYQQYDASAIENHTIYQFSDRNAFKSFLIELKKNDYKSITVKKRKNKKKKEKSKKDQEFYFLSEKNNSLVVAKDVFMLGFNVFLFSSYNSNSQIGKRILDEIELD